MEAEQIGSVPDPTSIRRVRGSSMRNQRLVVLVALVAVIATACTGGGSGSKKSQGEVALTFWNDAEAFTPDFLKALENGFEAKYPNIDLQVTNIPEAQYGAKIDTALAAHNPPDLGFVWDQRWIKAGLVLPLDDMVKQDGIDLSSYDPAIIPKDWSSASEGANNEFACAYGGHIYCLGSYTGMVALIYNKDMFDAAGIPYPSPWPGLSIDEFAADACKLTNTDAGVWGAAFGEPLSWLPWETVVSPDGRTAMGYVNSPTSISTHETLGRVVEDHCAPSLGTMDAWAQGVDFFVQKKLAMVITDLGGLPKIEKAGINYGITVPPTPPGVDPFFNVWTDSIGVFAGAEHPDAAKDFIDYQTTEGQRLRVQVDGEIPISTAVADQMNWAGDIPGREEALQVLQHARGFVFVPTRWDVYGPIFDAEDTIFGDPSAAKEQLDGIAGAIQTNLDKAWTNWESG
jgi:multiple sugar transport system substrate-binding protein